MSIFMSVLLVGVVLAHRDGHQEQELHVSDDLQIGDCKDWCSAKVERAVADPSLKECSLNKEKCTWDLVCSYSGVEGLLPCKRCQQCKSRCEPWCEEKIGKNKCGKDKSSKCTQGEVCGYGDGVKCSDCARCKQKAPTTTENVPADTGCGWFCKRKVGRWAIECDRGKTLCTWGHICTATWSLGSCSKCPECPTKDPACSFGVTSKLGGSMKNVCCKHTCGNECGGPLCAIHGRDSADCCGEKIKSAKKSCNGNLPPCVLNGSNSLTTWLGLVLTVLMALTAAS